MNKIISEIENIADHQREKEKHYRFTYIGMTIQIIIIIVLIIMLILAYKKICPCLTSKKERQIYSIPMKKRRKTPNTSIRQNKRPIQIDESDPSNFSATVYKDPLQIAESN